MDSLDGAESTEPFRDGVTTGLQADQSLHQTLRCSGVITEENQKSAKLGLTQGPHCSID
jgi:hypothetical protein